MLPLYVLANESNSIQGLIEEFNDELPNLVDSLQRSPMIAEKIRLSEIGGGRGDSYVAVCP
jgi:hypothetical protein